MENITDYDLIRAVNTVLAHCSGNTSECSLKNTCRLRVCEQDEKPSDDDRVKALRHALRNKEKVTRRDTDGHESEYILSAIIQAPYKGALINYAELLDINNNHSVLRCPLKEIK